MARLRAAVVLELAQEPTPKRALRDEFCVDHRIVKTSVPLFSTGLNGTMEVVPYRRPSMSSHPHAGAWQ